MMRASAVAGFTTAPPYIPECRSPAGPCTSIWKYASPRSDDRIDGIPSANIAESEMTTASAARRRLLLLDELGEVDAPDFLFALREHDDVARELAAGLRGAPRAP